MLFKESLLLAILATLISIAHGAPVVKLNFGVVEKNSTVYSNNKPLDLTTVDVFNKSDTQNSGKQEHEYKYKYKPVDFTTVPRNAEKRSEDSAVTQREDPEGNYITQRVNPDADADVDADDSVEELGVYFDKREGLVKYKPVDFTTVNGKGNNNKAKNSTSAEYEFKPVDFTTVVNQKNVKGNDSEEKGVSEALKHGKFKPVDFTIVNKTPVTENATVHNNDFKPVDFTTEVLEPARASKRDLSHARQSLSNSTTTANTINNAEGKQNQKYLNVPLKHRDGVYFITAKVGSHHHKLKLIYDAATLDIVIPSTSTHSLIPHLSKFNPTLSSSYQKQQQGANDNDEGDFVTSLENNGEVDVHGIWGRDVLELDGSSDDAKTKGKVEGVMLGLTSETKLRYGVFGLGPQSNEASYKFANTVDNNKQFTYDNFLTMMKQQGIISRKSYSVYLNEKNATDGAQLIFGGIDKAKYEDELTYLPLQAGEAFGNSTKSDTNMYITLDQISQDGKNLASKPYRALISGLENQLSVPTEVYKQIGSKYGNYSEIYKAYTIDCAATGPDLEFYFGGNSGNEKKVTVPFNNLVLNVLPELKKLGFNQCMVGIKDSGEDKFVLGSSFLQAAYVNFDFEDNKVGISQAKYSNETEVVSY